MSVRTLWFLIIVGASVAPLGAQGPASGEDGRHWAYTAPVRPPAPNVRDDAWPTTPIDRFVLAMGRILAVFDRRFVNDVGVNGPGVVIVETGKRLRYHVTGLFADYGAAMAGGVALIALLMWLRS